MRAGQRSRLGHTPQLVGLSKKEARQADARCSVLKEGVRLFKPVRWYLQQLKWSTGGEDAERATSWVELALDFYAAARVLLMLPAPPLPLLKGLASSSLSLSSLSLF